MNPIKLNLLVTDFFIFHYNPPGAFFISFFVADSVCNCRGEERSHSTCSILPPGARTAVLYISSLSSIDSVAHYGMLTARQGVTTLC